jgi:alcohol dehydrogenase class IV
MDVITQAIESMWSKNANNASIEYATEALKIISKYLDRYLDNDELVFDQIIKASNLAGKAINITATTAPHALSYLLTKKYGIAHGHAVAICMPGIIQQLSNFINVNQNSNLNLMIKKICDSLCLDSLEDLELWFKSLLERMKLESNVVQPDDIDYLIQGVNLERLNNHPIKVTSKDILRIYTDIQK